MKMNALSLYVTTCRMVFQADVNNVRAWNDINRLIMYLRQSLTCIVCGQLLKVPMSSSVASCQHHVCKSCVGRKSRLKPSCSWCKDYSKFIENIQLRILLQCYKRLTLYLKRSEISKKWASLQTGNTPGVLIGSSANSIYKQNNCPSNFKDLIDEGSNLQDKYTFFEPPSLRNLNKSNSQTSTITSTNDTEDNANKSMSTNVISNVKVVEKQDTHQLIKPQATIVRLTAVENSSINNQLIANTTHQLNNQQSNSSSNNSSLSSTNQPTTATPTKSKQQKIRKGCRCGLATLNPGKLTCCGQRCPCYVEGKACFECRCRGCRNNNGSNNNNGNNNNLTTSVNRSPSFTTTSSINISTNNLTSNTSTSPNLFTTSTNLQLNSLSANNSQTALLSPATTRNLLSPSFLLSSSNTPSTTLINNSNSNHQMLRQFQSGTKINIISSTSSSPSAAILLSGHNNVGGNVSAVGVDSLTLPFPTIENIEDQVILSENVTCIEEDATLHQSIIDN